MNSDRNISWTDVRKLVKENHQIYTIKSDELNEFSDIFRAQFSLFEHYLEIDLVQGISIGQNKNLKLFRLEAKYQHGDSNSGFETYIDSQLVGVLITKSLFEKMKIMPRGAEEFAKALLFKGKNRLKDGLLFNMNFHVSFNDKHDLALFRKFKMTDVLLESKTFFPIEIRDCFLVIKSDKNLTVSDASAMMDNLSRLEETGI